jgi:hypothetical protein
VAAQLAASQEGLGCMELVNWLVNQLARRTPVRAVRLLSEIII